jgi:hypothetical protein
VVRRADPSAAAAFETERDASDAVANTQLCAPLSWVGRARAQVTAARHVCSIAGLRDLARHDGPPLTDTLTPRLVGLISATSELAMVNAYCASGIGEE